MKGIEEEFPIPIRHLALILILVVLVAAAVFLFTRGNKFLLIELERGEISVGENTRMYVKIRNITEEDYDNVAIQLATKSPYVIIYYPGVPFARVNDENQLTLLIGPLRSEEETKKYRVDISGALPPGTLSMEVEVAVRLWMDNEKAEEQIHTLKIKSR